MRIDKKQKDLLKRKLKDRIPAARSKSLPKLALVIAATFCVSPEAWAKVEAQQAQPVLTAIKDDGSTKSTKTYSREELKEKSPPRNNHGVGERIRQEINGLLRQLGRNQSGKDERDRYETFRTNRRTAEEFQFAAASMKDLPEERRANVDAARAFYLEQLQTVGTDRINRELTFLQPMRAGFSFDIDIGAMFGSDKKQTKKGRGRIRYGLVLKEITPAKGPDRAVIGNDISEVQYAGHADVDWTIDVLEEDSDRALFNVTHPNEKATPTLWEKTKSMLSFKGNAKPVSFTNYHKLDPENPPQWDLEISQRDDLYKITERRKIDGERVSLAHEFKVPLIGEMKVGRRFLDNWDVERTSLYNILIDKRAPIVSVHKFSLIQRYSADVSYRFDEGLSSVSAEAQSRAYGEIDPSLKTTPEEEEEFRREQYKLSFNKRF